MVSVFKCTSKTARFRKWTVDFVSDKLALLIELNHQVVNKKTVREKETGRVGHAPPKTKLRRAILKLVKVNLESCIPVSSIFSVVKAKIFLRSVFFVL
jgi:DNA-binding XRE family transcriptional regulator